MSPAPFASPSASLVAQSKAWADLLPSLPHHSEVDFLFKSTPRADTRFFFGIDFAAGHDAIVCIETNAFSLKPSEQPLHVVSILKTVQIRPS